VGIRPEDMEDASLVQDAPADRRIRVAVDLRESLGSDVVVHFTLPARRAITDEVREALEVEETAEEAHAEVLARLSPRTRAEKGSQVELVVDTSRLHVFDPVDGSGIY
ncbi:MAG: TOBE domain-containing protein, partial [Acidimicrobiales bacterium]